MTGKESTTVELSNEVVTNYVEKEFALAFKKVEKERHGEGCGCASCLKTAVWEINTWLTFLDAPDYLFYDVQLVNDKLTIVGKHGK